MKANEIGIMAAIGQSIDRDEIAHVCVEGGDIYDLLKDTTYEDFVRENDGSYDVWGCWDGDNWRINVTII